MSMVKSLETDSVRWRFAEALAIEKLHRGQASIYVAERIGALALQGDSEGIERFRAIAAALDTLERQNKSAI